MLHDVCFQRQEDVLIEALWVDMSVTVRTTRNDHHVDRITPRVRCGVRRRRVRLVLRHATMWKYLGLFLFLPTCLRRTMQETLKIVNTG